MDEYTHHDLTYHIREAKKDGAAEMRERAAKAVEESMWRARDAIANEVRALPLDTEKAAPAGEG